MRNLRLFAGLACPLAIAGSQAMAAKPPGTLQFHDVIYDVPADWWHGKTTSTYTVLVPHKLLGSFIYVLRGGPIDGELGPWAGRQLSAFNDARNADQIASDRRTITSSQVKPVKLRSTPGVLVTQRLSGTGRGSAIRMGIAVAAGGRGDLVVLDAEDAQAAKGSVAAFTQLAERMRLVSKGATPLMPPPTPGTLEGIFTASQLQPGVNGLQNIVRYYLFDKAGHAYADMPRDRPIAPLDFAAATEDAPDEGGSYTVDGRTLRLAFADGHREDMPIASADDGALALDGQAFRKVAPPPDGTRLDGCWSSLSYSAFTPGSGLSGGVSSSHSFTFRGDGTYQTDGFTGVAAGFEDGGGNRTGGMAVNSGAKRGAGAYAVKDGLITLTAGDGTVTRRTLLFPDASRELAVIGGSNFLRQSNR